MVRGVTNDRYAVEFILDDEDAALLERNWYATFNKREKLTKVHVILYSMKTGEQLSPLSLHRVVMGLKPGDPRVVDHIDGNPANNQKENLRLCTKAENGRNQAKRRDNNSGFKGASWDMSAKKWKSRIVINYKIIYLGLFDTPEEAHEAYCRAAEKYHGEYARYE